jgi:lipopolysaccharide export system permease protein
MLQNKIYQNFIKEILKTFLVILFGLSIIAWTVRAVNFLDLIVESGYSIDIYFQYSFLNLFSIFTKFIPLSFLIALVVFIIKQIQENEFIILWTSGVEKLKLANLFFTISLIVLFFYLIFSIFITPYALNKSRLLLSKDGFNSFLPTVRVQQFSDSFKGFTFIVEKKFKNEIKNVFIHDNGNTLKNITTNQSDSSSTTIIANEGIIEEKKMVLFNGQILTTDKSNLKNSIIKFEQLSVDLKNLTTDTIKLPKFQERPTISLLKCLMSTFDNQILNCNKNSKKEMTTVLNRRVILPFYLPILALICSFLLLKKRSKKNLFLNKYSIFTICFLILLSAEISIRYTGISKIIGVLFIATPVILIPIIYLLLMISLSRETYTK